MPILLLTRPLSASKRYTAQFETEAEVVISPVLEIVAVEPDTDIPDFGSVIFTSQNAVEHYDGPSGCPAHVVGPRTADLARDAGFEVVTVAPNADTLVGAIPDDAAQPLLHVRGRYIAQPLAQRLAARGLICTDRVVYDQKACPMNAAAADALKGEQAVVLPLFSPRSAALVCLEMSRLQRTAPVLGVAISDAVAQVAQAQGVTVFATATHPDAGAMAEAVRAALAQGRLLEGGAALP